MQHSQLDNFDTTWDRSETAEATVTGGTWPGHGLVLGKAKHWRVAVMSIVLRVVARVIAEVRDQSRSLLW